MKHLTVFFIVLIVLFSNSVSLAKGRGKCSGSKCKSLRSSSTRPSQSKSRVEPTRDSIPRSAGFETKAKTGQQSHKHMRGKTSQTGVHGRKGRPGRIKEEIEKGNDFKERKDKKPDAKPDQDKKNEKEAPGQKRKNGAPTDKQKKKPANNIDQQIKYEEGKHARRLEHFEKIKASAADDDKTAERIDKLIERERIRYENKMNWLRARQNSEQKPDRQKYPKTTDSTPAGQMK